MKNISAIKPKCSDGWIGDIDLNYYFVTFKPLTDREFSMYDNKKGYMALSVMERIEEIEKYFIACNIPYEGTGKWAPTIKVKKEYFEFVKNEEPQQIA